MGTQEKEPLVCQESGRRRGWWRMWCGFSLEEGDFALKTGGVGPSREASPSKGVQV